MGLGYLDVPTWSGALILNEDLHQHVDDPDLISFASIQHL